MKTTRDTRRKEETQGERRRRQQETRQKETAKGETRRNEEETAGGDKRIQPKVT